MIRWNMSSLNNLLFYLLTYQMIVHFNVFRALVKCWISTMWIAAYLLQYNLIEHSGANPSSNQQVSDLNHFTSYICHPTILRLCTKSWHRTLLLVFHDTRFLSKKHAKACGKTLINMWSLPLNIWKTSNVVVSIIRI